MLYANPDGENRRKNRVHKELLDNGQLGLGTLGADGVYTFKSGVGFAWSWAGAGATRVLQVSITGTTLTAQRRATLQEFCDAQFGIGRVVLL